MKCTLTVCFATALLTTDLAKATAEPALKLHFVGIENLIQREDAKTLKAVWAQKETRTLRTEALGKLAKHLAAQSGKGVSIFNSILPDIGLGETYLTIAPGDRNPDVTFMAAMSKTRGEEWVKRLKQISAHDRIEQEEKIQAGYTGWRVDYKNGRSVGFGYANGWLLLGIGKSTFVALKQASQQIADTGRPSPANTEQDLTLELTLLSQLPALQNLLSEKANAVRLTSRLRKDNFFTKAVVTYDEALSANTAKWEIPTRTITEPLASFTAARGVGLATARSVLGQIQLKPANDQFFAWSQARTKFQSFFAVKVGDPAAEIAGLAKRIDTFKKPGGAGENYIGKVVHDPKKPVVTWGNVPLFAPYLTKANSADKGYVVGGVFPPDPIKKPIPQELLNEFINKKNLVYYNWEITGQRLEKWNLLIQFAAILSDRREQLVNKTKGIDFITSLYPKLGNTITDATVNGKELTITRKSHLGLSALEIALLTRWLDNPQFPKPTLEWPKPAETPRAKPRRIKPRKKPAAKK